MSHESLIGTTHDFSNGSPTAASTSSLTTPGVTSSPILKSLKRQRLPASSPYHDRLDLGWGIIACPGSFSPQAIATERSQISDWKTTWKNALVLVTSTIILAENLDAWCLISPPTMLSPLKTPTGSLSRTNGSGGGTAILCHQALTRPSAVVAVTMPACLHRLYQSRTWLQLAWTGLFLVLVSQSQIMKNTIENIVLGFQSTLALSCRCIVQINVFELEIHKRLFEEVASWPGIPMMWI